MVFEGGASLSIYIDGALSVSATTNISKRMNASNAGGIGGVFGTDAFGANSTTVNNFYSGHMDAFAVYESVLTESEVEQSACYTPNGICTNIAKTTFEAFWDFDNGNAANDVSGNGNNPLLALDPSISFDNVDYKDGDQSIVFGGSSGIQYTDFNDGDLGFLNGQLNARSIVVWIKPTALNGLQIIFEEGGLQQGIATRLNDANLEFIVRSSSSVANIISAAFPNDGHWHHLAFTYDGPTTTQAIYIDGVIAVSETSSDIPTSVPDHDSKDGIGARISGKDAFLNQTDPSFFTGHMDAFAVIQQSLTPEQVTALTTQWFSGVDNDADTYYGSQLIVNQCFSPGANFSQNPVAMDDCNDDIAAINPNATEILDGLDNNCDGTIDEGTTYTFNGSWSPSNPVSTNTHADIIIESGHAVINGDTTCNTLTVNPGAAITIDNGVTLTVIDTDNTAFTLQSTSTAYSSLILDGDIIGTVNYERHVNSYSNDAIENDNDLISPPLNNQSVVDFANENVGILMAQGVNPITYAIAPFNNDNGNYENLNSNSVANLVSGFGYRMATTTSDVTLKFTGIPIKGVYNVEIPIGADAIQGSWNLIGNPYPSYIDFSTFFAQLISDAILEDGYVAIYGFDGSASDGWTILDGNSVGLVAPGQGFFVKTDDVLLGADPTPQITFTPAMRVSGSSDDFILGKNASISRATINLDLNASSYQTNFYFKDNGTRGLDYGYDTSVYEQGSYNIFSHLVEGNTGLELFNQALLENDYTNLVVPLGIRAGVGESISISLDNSSYTLPGTIEVYLEDTFTNTFTLLNTGDYNITPSVPINGAGRFFLHFQENTLTNPEINLNDILVYLSTSAKTLTISGTLINGTDLTVYDIQGRVVLEKELNANTTTNTVDVSYLNDGVYVVKISNKEQSKIQKVIIN